MLFNVNTSAETNVLRCFQVLDVCLLSISGDQSLFALIGKVDLLKGYDLITVHFTVINHYLCSLKLDVLYEPVQ